MRNVTAQELAAAKAAENHPLVQIFEQVVNNLGLNEEGLAYLKSIITDGGIDFSNPEELAALDNWCLHTFNFSSPQEEAMRTRLYRALVDAGYPPKWDDAIVNEIHHLSPNHQPVPLFFGLNAA